MQPCRRPWPPWRISSQRPVRPPRCTAWRCQHRTKPNDDLRWLSPHPGGLRRCGAILFGSENLGTFFGKNNPRFFWDDHHFSRSIWMNFGVFFNQKNTFFRHPHFMWISVCWPLFCVIEIPSFLVICTAPFLETFPGSSATGDHGSPGPWPRILRDWLAAKWWIHGIIFIFLLGTYQIILNINNMSVAFLWITSSYQWFFGVSIMLEAPNKFYIMGLITISIDGQEDSWGPWPAFWDPPGPLRDTDICPTEILCGRCRCGSLWPWWPLAMGSQLVASCLGWCREVTPNWLLGWFMALSLPGPIIDVFVDVNTL